MTASADIAPAAVMDSRANTFQSGMATSAPALEGPVTPPSTPQDTLTGDKVSKSSNKRSRDDDDDTSEPVAKKLRPADTLTHASVPREGSGSLPSPSSQIGGHPDRPITIDDEDNSQATAAAFPQPALTTLPQPALPQAVHSSAAGRSTCTIGGASVNVITDPSQVNFNETGVTFYGLNQKATAFLKNKLAIPFDESRPRTYARYNDMGYHLRLPSAAHAQQHRDSAWERAATYPDPTYQTVRANDIQNAGRWYDAAIDLAQMRDKLSSRGKGADKFIKVDDQGRTHYKHQEISGLYFKFMDIVADGTLNGFRTSTNPRHRTIIRKSRYAVNLSAHDRLEAALQALRNEKAIIGDLLGPSGAGNLIEFVAHPTAYADLKKDDRRTNTNRGLPKAQRSKPGDPDVYPWSALPPNERARLMQPYPAWHTILPRDPMFPRDIDYHLTAHLPPPADDRVYTTASAQAYFATLAHYRRTPAPTTPDPFLAHFTTHIDGFARLLADAATSSACAQDSQRSTHLASFTAAPPAHTTGAWETQSRNVQAWAYRVCEKLVDGALNGFPMTPRDGQTPPESDRHPTSKLAAVFGGANVGLWERFGAVHAALLVSKAVAAPFVGCVEGFLRVEELLGEPLCFLETKLAHRKSNSKRRSGAGADGNGHDDGDDNDDAPGPDGGNDEAPTTTKRKRDDEQQPESGEQTGDGDDAPAPQRPQKRARGADPSSKQGDLPDYPPIFAPQPDVAAPSGPTSDMSAVSTAPTASAPPNIPTEASNAIAMSNMHTVPTGGLSPSNDCAQSARAGSTKKSDVPDYPPIFAPQPDAVGPSGPMNKISSASTVAAEASEASKNCASDANAGSKQGNLPDYPPIWAPVPEVVADYGVKSNMPTPSTVLKEKGSTSNNCASGASAGSKNQESVHENFHMPAPTVDSDVITPFSTEALEAGSVHTMPTLTTEVFDATKAESVFATTLDSLMAPEDDYVPNAPMESFEDWFNKFQTEQSYEYPSPPLTGAGWAPVQDDGSVNVCGEQHVLGANEDDHDSLYKELFEGED
ncbi:hypothetical protein UCDDS831_g09254 [Diplodia seriata]|uniref:Uncharacterized protein n=1 Tax=Diplodia seriata TaxID=420778 RepID=A0A0G2DSA9_9PEZI|nr:hypothetical protein UCDDS831_g09254 [Diplodia seriata]